MKTDVKAASVAASGTVYAGRTRVRGVVVMPTTGSSAAIATFSNGANSVMTFTAANGVPLCVTSPEDGVLFSTSVEVVLTDATVTVFYG